MLRVFISDNEPLRLYTIIAHVFNIMQNPLRTLSVSQTVALLMTALIIIAGMNIGVVFYFQSQVSEDSNAIDVAGQQRMLTQQMTRHANRLATGDESAREPLQAAAEKYQSNLAALEQGGTVDGTTVPAVPTSAQDQLETEKEEWNSFESNVQTVLDAEPGSPEFEAALSEIQANSDSLLATSDDLVKALSEANSQKLGFMQQLLVLLLLADLVVFGAGVYVSRKYIGSPLARLDTVAADIAGGNLNADVSGAHPHFEEGSDEIAGLATTIETLRSNVTERIDTAETAKANAQSAEAEAKEAREQAEQAQQEAKELNAHLQEKAEQFGMRMDKAADGDMTQRMDPDSQSAAMTDIADSFNGMMAELEQTFAELHTFADDVASFSEEVTASAEESQNASEQISESVQSITVDAESQSKQLRDASSEMQNLSGTVEEVASSANEIADRSQSAAELGQEGQSAASAAMSTMTEIEAKSETTVNEIETLASEIEEIGEIVDLITDIAEQTNMLALNASIEAARAGEAGEGFAVVAGEIKQLAGETAEATDEIEQRITGIQSTSRDAVADIQEMGDRIATGSDTIEEGLSALDEVAESIEVVNQSIQEISAATDEQAGSTENVATMIDDVAEAASEVSAESENVSAATEEQTSSLTEVAESARTLTSNADTLQRRLNEFNVDTQLASGTATQATAPDGGSDSV